MTATLAPDSDFDDLDAIIAEASLKQTDRAALAAKQKRLSAISGRRSGDAEIERQALITVIRQLEESLVWTTVGCVALFDSQDCEACGHTHTLFVGWMTLQKHKSDVTCTRMLAGRPIEPLPISRKTFTKHVSVCIDCFEETYHV